MPSWKSTHALKASEKPKNIAKIRQFKREVKSLPASQNPISSPVTETKRLISIIGDIAPSNIPLSKNRTDETSITVPVWGTIVNSATSKVKYKISLRNAVRRKEKGPKRKLDILIKKVDGRLTNPKIIAKIKY